MPTSLRARTAVGLLFLATVGCARGTTATVPAAAGVEHVVAVVPDPQKRSGVLLLQWDGELGSLGDRMALLDDTGYHGLIRTRARSTVDCDHCPGPLVEAVLLEGRGPSDVGSIAVGPVAGPLPRARLARSSGDRGRTASWQPVLRIDLEGDGRWDVDEVQRCGHTVASGCSASVCDMICTAIVPSGTVPEPSAMRCRSFVPDVEDCGGGAD